MKRFLAFNTLSHDIIPMENLYETIQLHIIETQRLLSLENSNVIPDYDEVIQNHPEVHIHGINSQLVGAYHG